MDVLNCFLLMIAGYVPAVSRLMDIVLSAGATR
mgnify:CR=1 FL=1